MFRVRVGVTLIVAAVVIAGTAYLLTRKSEPTQSTATWASQYCPIIGTLKAQIENARGDGERQRRALDTVARDLGALQPAYRTREFQDAAVSVFKDLRSIVPPTPLTGRAQDAYQAQVAIISSRFLAAQRGLPSDAQLAISAIKGCDLN